MNHKLTIRWASDTAIEKVSDTILTEDGYLKEYLNEIRYAAAILVKDFVDRYADQVKVEISSEEGEPHGDNS